VRRIALSLIVLLAVLLGERAIWSADLGRFVWIGTYTGPKSQGIYAFRFDATTGTLTAAGVAARTPSPSFLALHPNGHFLYAVNETHDGRGNSGAVSAFAIDPGSGHLTTINSVSSHGGDPCHLALDATGRFLIVANYSSGNVTEFKVEDDGRIGAAISVMGHNGSGPIRSRQGGPHAHQVVFDRDNRHVITVDLGSDDIFVYAFDPATGALTQASPPSAHVTAGAGPRHFVFHPDGRHAFGINELASTITAYTWDRADGRLTPGPSVSTLPADFKGTNSTAELAIDTGGRFLYGSNRGHDSIAVFKVDGSGAATLVEHTSTRGKTPRNFALDPTGRWLIAANQESDSLAVFRVDPATGRLAPVGEPARVGTPVCLLFQ
jgi:6-phosphogluconolactonase